MARDYAPTAEANIGLVYLVAQKRWKALANDEDFIQTGMQGLVEAVKKLDPERSQAERTKFLMTAIHRVYCKEMQKRKSNGISMMRGCNAPVNTHQALSEDYDVPIEATQEDSLLVRDGEYARSALRKFLLKEMHKVLSAKQRNVMLHRYGFEGRKAKNATDTAKALGVSRQAVHLAEARCYEILAHSMRKYRRVYECNRSA